ncbi:MAG: CRISPR system precrRNA processing endoribonuclease RAMP protein Cas6 [Anaerolineales bacterium]|nr:MAG: CRISPR system precrRNA processing endoribonuclease RAMP protein Cas6 [Anaerolineales bacterium]
MPYAITLPLVADSDAPFPTRPHRALQGAFYSWLKQGDPDLAGYVHELAGLKPFTVTPLSRRNGQPCCRFTLLDDALWPPLEAALSDGAQVEIVNQRWPVAQEGQQVEHCSYADLVANAEADTSLAFRFVSPTSFRSQDMHYPLPDPVLTFQSWLLRWNAFAPQDLRLNVNTLDVVAAHVAIARFRLETRAVRFDRYTQIGFVGAVTYRIIKSRRLGNELIRRLNVLADYAPFCGTGHKTTQGMGQTRRLYPR